MRENDAFWKILHNFPRFLLKVVVRFCCNFAIEIKSSNAPEAKLSANTKKYLDLRKDENARNAVFYLGDISMVINGTSYISWRNWGEYLS